MLPVSKVPLFVTGFSLSSKTAIGTQTKHLLAAFPEANHLYWRRFTFEKDRPNSFLLEHPIVSRYGALQRASSLRRVSRLLGLNQWRDDALIPAKAKWVEELASKVSTLYIAPIDRPDASRMRYLVGLLDRPYLLHLWDSLDDPIQDDPNFVWLIQNARKVMVLSRSLQDEVRALGVESEMLLFTRPSSSQHAHTAPDVQKVRIGLLGDILSYFDGMKVLDGAVATLIERGVAVDLVYIGPPAVAKRINARLQNKVVCTGFLSEAERDATLASCHFGYLPGPGQSPETNLRSRYSIPSRTLDFLSVGLPIIGPIHSDSTTVHFLRSLGITENFAYDDVVSLADRIQALCQPEVWHTAAAASAEAFDRFQAEKPIEKFQAAMVELDRSDGDSTA